MIGKRGFKVVCSSQTHMFSPNSGAWSLSGKPGELKRCVGWVGALCFPICLTKGQICIFFALIHRKENWNSGTNVGWTSRKASICGIVKFYNLTPCVNLLHQPISRLGIEFTSQNIIIFQRSFHGHIKRSQAAFLCHLAWNKNVLGPGHCDTVDTVEFLIVSQCGHCGHNEKLIIFTLVHNLISNKLNWVEFNSDELSSAVNQQNNQKRKPFNWIKLGFLFGKCDFVLLNCKWFYSRALYAGLAVGFLLLCFIMLSFSILALPFQ